MLKLRPFREHWLVNLHDQTLSPNFSANLLFRQQKVCADLAQIVWPIHCSIVIHSQFAFAKQLMFARAPTNKWNARWCPAEVWMDQAMCLAERPLLICTPCWYSATPAQTVKVKQTTNSADPLQHYYLLLVHAWTCPHFTPTPTAQTLLMYDPLLLQKFCCLRFVRC